MPIQEFFSIAKRERACQIPAVEERIRNRNPVREQDQSVGELSAVVDNLQRIVCELLLENQVLRMALVRVGEIVPFYSFSPEVRLDTMRFELLFMIMSPPSTVRRISPGLRWFRDALRRAGRVAT